MRRQENDPLDQFIKDQFEAYEPEAPEMVWKSIERELDRESIFRRRIAIARWAVAASVLMCIFFAAFYFSSDLKKDMAIIEKPVPAKSGQTVNENTPVQKPEIPELQAAVRKEQPRKETKKITVKGEMPVLAKQEKQKNAAPVQTETEVPAPVQEPVIIAQEIPADQYIPAKQTEPISSTLKPPQGSKTVVTGVTDVVNYLAKKVKKDDEELIKINRRSIDTNTNVMSYNIDLGFLKISRVKHQSN